MAKLIIFLTTSIAEVVNNDEDVSSYLKVVFLPNYCVSFAEIIIPGCDISQHISTAGMEASGTSNMKFALNGVLILGTMDGANVEIAEEIGQENMFIFGATADKVPELRHLVRMNKAEIDPRFIAVLQHLKNGQFGDPYQWRPILQNLENGNDYYLLGVDCSSYLGIQEKIDKCFVDKESWLKKSILSTSGAGKFSSDRTIHEYADEIWGIQQVRRPGAKPVMLQRLTSRGIVPETSELGISPSFEKDSILMESNTPLEKPKYAITKIGESQNSPEKSKFPSVKTSEPEAVEGFDVSDK